jgi:hypothetical protein
MAVIKNQKFGTAAIHQIASGTTTIAGNSTVSNVCSTGETVIGASVRKAAFSSNGSWTIYRGANAIAVLHGTGVLDWAGMGLALGMDKAATLVINLSASSTGSIVVEIAKESNST